MKLALAIAISTLLASSFAFTEPYLAVREGLKCSACHGNMTGGGKRTRMGTGYGAQDLPWKPLDLQDQKLPHYFSFFNDVISFGGDFRVAHQSTFSKGDLVSDSFQTEKSDLYLQADLVPSHVRLYIDEMVAPGGAQTREIFGMFRGLPGRTWIKAGKFLLPYGLRLEDDRAFIREITGFNFNNPDSGIEIGLEPGAFSFVGSITNGTASISDSNTSKQLTGTAGYIADCFRVGGSASYNDSGIETRKTGGIWAGLRVRKLVLLGETDWIHDESNSGKTPQLLTYAEADYEIAKGWNLKFVYEYFDPNRNISENERDRIVIGIEPILTSFVHLQLFYRLNQSIPQNITQNADELSFRLHIYF